jgi:hypothetical protein
MTKIKMRCITCGKWFQSANAKEVTCPDCTQRARREKLEQRNAPPPTRNNAPRPPVTNTNYTPPVKPRSTQSGTNQWLDKLSDVKVSQSDEPNQRSRQSPPIRRDNDRKPNTYRTGGNNNYNSGNYRGNEGSYGPAAYRIDKNNSLSPSIGQRPQPLRPQGNGGPQKPWQKNDRRNPNSRGYNQSSGPKERPKNKPARQSQPPRPKREKTPPPAPFVPTQEQIQQVEERYIALAQPSEFDGIRTQIAQELSIPKKAVKKIIKDLRSRQQIPSWWEIQTYKGSSEELEKIKAAYEPYLPVPPVGVHKLIGNSLDIKPTTIYQAIKTIRAELNLPQYNDPTLHEEQSETDQQKSASPTLSSAVENVSAEPISQENRQDGVEAESEI